MFKTFKYITFFDSHDKVEIFYRPIYLIINCGQLLYIFFYFNTMTEVTIDHIEKSFDQILTTTGENSFVQWETFTKSSTGLTKQMDELQKSISIYREIQQRRFIINMKKLKGCDVPDLIKTVKSKKLPK